MQPQQFESFAAALVDPAAALPAGLRGVSGAPLAERFAVYRNNVHSSLVAALAARFPVCEQLLGSEFFQATARVFVAMRRPDHARLLDYGAAFPDFLAGFEPLAALPCVPDIARLECLWTECWGAAEAPTLSAAQLARHEPAQLLAAVVRPHPAARLLRSEFPVATLWELHQGPEPDLADLQWQSESVLLCRPQARVQLRQLNADVAAFTGALLGGEDIENAALAALAFAPDFDLGSALAGLAEDGFITGIIP